MKALLILVSLMLMLGFLCLSSVAQASCPMPQGLMTNSVTTTTASLSWNSDSSFTSFILYYRKAGTALWQPTSSTSDTFKVVTALEAGTVYEAYLEAQCSTGTSICPSITFSTASFWQENDFGDFYTGSSIARVGIGTAAPAARLHVQGGLLMDGQVGTLPTTGAGTRLMWVPDRAAFRVGEVAGTEWDTIGQASAAMGKNSKATGIGSMAFGDGAEALGDHSVAIGHNVKSTAANAVAIGNNGTNEEANTVAIFTGGVVGGGPTIVIGRPGNGPPDFGPPEQFDPSNPCDEEENREITEISGYLYLKESDNGCGGQFCAEGSLWARDEMRVGLQYNFSDDCDPQNSWRIRRIKETINSVSKDNRLDFILPSGTHMGPQIMRFHRNLDKSQAYQQVPEISLGQFFPTSSNPFRLRVGATTNWNGAKNAVLADGSIEIHADAAAWAHNFVVTLNGSNQSDRDNMNCYTVNNGSTTVFNVTGAGNVTAHGTLRVAKDIHCERAKISLNPLTASIPDYVFEHDYPLMPLNELRSFLQQECHLPGVPSATEMLQNGSLDVADMQFTLLEKVEELSLYILQLDERIQSLEEENRRLREAK